MTDLRTLPAPFDRLAAVLEIAAAANRGHIAYESTVRARRSGDMVTIDIALWMATPSGETLFAIDLAPGASPVEVDAVEAAASRRDGLDARGAAIAASAGFSRNARRRADELGVALIDLHDQDSTSWPSWLASGGFESQDLHWVIRNVLLPPVPGLPERFFQTGYSPGDALFANPQGRKFTPEELLRRWLRAGNEAALRQGLPHDGRHVQRPVVLQFDRPMTILANTVRQLPPIAACEFVLEAWLEVTRVPMNLVEGPDEDLEGAPRVAYASAPPPGEEVGPRIWMWLAPGEDGEPALRMELLPREQASA